MKTSNTGRGFSQNLGIRLARTILLPGALLFSATSAVHAQVPEFTNSNYYGHPLMAWSFNDTNNWTDDAGYAPVSFGNLTGTLLGDGTAVVVDSGDPAWLQYNVTEASGTNNLKVDRGSVMFWFAPSWSGTNAGGTGPGVWGRLIEVGAVKSNGWALEYATNLNALGSLIESVSLKRNGWWSLYVDPDGANIYFAGQTNGGTPVLYLSAPIDWTTNYWHLIALTYTATNSKLYLDGWLATNGPGVTDYPGPDVLTNGFFIGSDGTGNNQAHGMFDDLYTYDRPINYGIVGVEYLTGMMTLRMNSLNPANFPASAVSTPTSTATEYNFITGPGYLTNAVFTGSCVTNNNVWLTNMSAAMTAQGMTFNFAIVGGTNGYQYDVFATPALTPTLTNGLWSWMGQGDTCYSYSIPQLPTTGAVFFILGTPKDTDGDGLTDAYERLVSHTDPTKADTDGDGIPDGWAVYLGMTGNGNDSSNPNARSNFSYTLADWLNGVGGIKSGTVGTDNEGNVTTAAQ